MVDKVNDALAFDLTLSSVLARFDALIRALEYVCTSFSQSLRPAVRDHCALWGLAPRDLPARIGGCTGEEYLQLHNELLTGFLRLLRAVVAAGVEFWVEQPGDARPPMMPDGVTTNPFYHPRARHAPHLFQMVEWLLAVAGVGGSYIAFLQCPHGAPSKQPTWVYATPRLAARWQHLARMPCTCTSHARLRGRNRAGEALTRLAQAYPGALNLEFCDGVDAEFPAVAAAPAASAPAVDGTPEVVDEDALTDHEPPSLASASEGGSDSESPLPQPTPQPDARAAPSGGADVEGAGEIAWGPRLDVRVRAAVEEVRRAPAHHASWRRADAASLEALRAAPYKVVPPHDRRATPPRAAGQPNGAPDATLGAAYSARPSG
eukprot:5294436-Prymnesium_polylepis.2